MARRPSPRTILASLALVLACPAAAQVVRDGSIGPPATGLPVPSGVDPTGELVDYLISQDLGETQGPLLYHSFGTFSIGAGEIASFTGADAIEVVLTRVTSADGAFLNGVLRSTLPNAELFFVSPGGIVIGEGARLDVPGSIHFGTADVVRFGADPAFDLPTGSLSRPTLLSSAPPQAFGFGPDPTPIAVGVVDPTDASQTLRVPAGAALSFIGGDVTFTGAPLPFQGNVIGSPGSTVQIASTAGDQDVPLTQTPGGTRLDLDQLPPDALDGNVALLGNARIDVGWPFNSSGAAGSVIVRAGTFSIVDGRIVSVHRDDARDAGPIDIGVRDEILLDGASIAASTFGQGRGADIAFEAGSVEIVGDSLLRIGSVGEGDGGDFTIVADQIVLAEQADLISQSLGSGAGSAIRLTAVTEDGDGHIRIEGEGVAANGVRRPSTLQSQATGQGDGGDIGIVADLLTVSNVGEITSTTSADAATTGGSIAVQATSLIVRDGSFVTTATSGPADGGALTVEGRGGALAESVLVQNAPGNTQPARISTNTTGSAPGAGSGGALTLRSDTLQLLDGGQVFARTEGSGDAGALEVLADRVEIRGVLVNPDPDLDPFPSGITSRVNAPGAQGSGTLLSIDTRLLEVHDGGQISTATFGIGDAGDLLIVARERMTVEGGANGASLVSAAAVAGPSAPGGGAGGLISIDAGRLELLDGGQITSSTTGEGNPGAVGDAGDVVVMADSLEIRGAAGFDTSGIFSRTRSIATQGVGDSGNITLDVAGDASVADGALIEVSTSGEGEAGNVLFAVGGNLDVADGARIQSASDDQSLGSAGSVTLDVGGDLSIDGGALVGASTGSQSTGSGGVVMLTAGRDLRLGGGSRISSSSAGFGDAGDIEIEATRVLAHEGSAIETQARNASGGSIAITASELFELRGASTTTSVQGTVATSDAGNVRIETPGSAVINRGVLVADAIEGAGGRIDLVAGDSFISGDSVISASSESGPQGVVAVTPPENALLVELSSLPADFADPSGLLASDCAMRTEREGSFTVRTRPDAALPPDLRLPAHLASEAAGPAQCEEPANGP